MADTESSFSDSPILIPFSPEFLEKESEKKVKNYVNKVNSELSKIKIDLSKEATTPKNLNISSLLKVGNENSKRYFQKLGEFINSAHELNASGELSKLKKLTGRQLKYESNIGLSRSFTTDISTETLDIERKYQEAGEALKQILYKNATPRERRQMDLERLSSNLDSQKGLFEDYKVLGKDTKDVEKNIKNIQKEMAKLEKGKPLSGVQKLFNTFKRVGFYRIARRFFQLIEQGLGQGLEQLISFDSEANKTMSSIKSSFEKVGASVAIMVMPLIEIAEPIISSMADTVSNFANNISMASAYMKGLGEYTKVSEEYMKDLQSEANSTLTSFDKFESLNGKASPFEKAKIEDEDKEKAEQYGDTIERIQGIFSKLWEFVKGVGKIILELFEELEPYLDDILDFGLLLIDGIATVLAGVGKIFAFIGKIIDTKGELIALLAVITSIAATIAFLTGHYIKGAMITLGGITSMGIIGASQFAEGGTPTQGSLFYAGEAGAELVTTMPSGQTGVTNIAQFRQAMSEALFEWWSDAKYDLPEGSSYGFDGAEVARSKSFINEFNRRNSGVKIR